MSTLRLRRLSSDYEHLLQFVEKQPRIHLVAAVGNPPETYRIEYRVRSVRKIDDKIQYVEQHVVEISLPRDYPKVAPHCRMLSPVFHPNIAPHAICVGDHWSVGEPLWSIVLRIGEMLAYQAYNTKSPLNGEAARWADQHKDRLPLDSVQLLATVPRPSSGPAAKSVSVGPNVAGGSGTKPAAVNARSSDQKRRAEETHDRIAAACQSCGATYEVSTKHTGKRFRCKKCGSVVNIGADSPRCHFRDVRTRTPVQQDLMAINSSTSINDKIRLRCPNCNVAYKAPAAWGGRVIDCPKCNSRLVVRKSGSTS
jgi:ubiquitin-protein ligase/DNA-directed RNA polymerase subunit RPC12/RpoP